jgi:hypothetical protein
LGHFRREDTLYESAGSGQLYFRFRPFFKRFSQLFPSISTPERSDSPPYESGPAPLNQFAVGRKFGKPTGFALHLFWDVRAVAVNLVENLPFSFCFFTIGEYPA